MTGVEVQGEGAQKNTNLTINSEASDFEFNQSI